MTSGGPRTWLPLVTLALVAGAGNAAEGEFQIAVDGAPKRYALRAGGGSNLTDFAAEDRYSRGLGVRLDLVYPDRYNGFSESVFPVGGIGLEYRYASDPTVAAQDLALWFHYGLAVQPVNAVRLDLQIGLAPVITAAELTTPSRPSATGNWLLSGGAAEAVATLGVRVNPWLGLLARGGVETTYVSGRNDRDSVTLRSLGGVVGAGVILVW